eukprot:COSAG05_NODE_2235_length_3357_cov_13.339779_4_plen_76_part_00
MATGVFEDTDKLAPFTHFTKHTRQALELVEQSLIVDVDRAGKPIRAYRIHFSLCGDGAFRRALSTVYYARTTVGS